jgi:type IV fimbrial biogenesis protein FimT
MVTLSILGVLMSIAIPSFQSLIASSKLSSASSDFITALAQTRSSASRLGERVTLCKSSNGTQCSTTGDWEQGWIIFNDPTRSVDANVDTGLPTETVITLSQAITGGIVIRGNSTVAQYVSYSSDGQSRAMNGAFQAGKIRICSTSNSLSNDKRARDLVINSVGRVLVQTPTNIDPSCPAPT